METYTFLRHMADSWFLLMMTLIFLGIILWAFRPGSRALHRDVATSIFRNDDRPAPVTRAPVAPPQAKMKEG